MVNPEPSELSERELEILRLVATGASNKEIAAQLFISSNTVKVHLRNIFAKIGATSRTEAAMHAVRIGLVRGAPGQTPSEGTNSPIITTDLQAQPGATVETSPPSRIWPRWVIAILTLVVIGLASLTYALGRGSVSQITPSPPTMVASTSISSSRWQTLESLPEPRRGLALASFENQLFAIGGENNQGITNTLESYNLDTKTWSSLSTKPTPVTDVMAAVISGLIYIPGGRTGPDPLQITNALEIYDPSLDAWSSGANLPVPISAYALLAFEGRLYLFGGWDGMQYLSTVYVYEPALDAWQERSPMPTARAFCGAAIAGGKIYVLGGTAGGDPLDVNEIYSPARDADSGENPWETGFPIPDTRLGFQVTTIADTLYLLGGTDSSGSQYGLIYFPPTNTWQSLEASPQALGGYFGLASVGPQLFVVGGEADDEPSDKTLAYQALITLSIPIVIK